MPEFQNEFPDVRLSFELAGGEMKGALEACDLGLRHETNVAPQDHAVAVVPEWIVAVASPEYIKRQGMLDAPLSDNTHSLVTLVDARISWQFFFDETSQHPEKRLPEIQVPDYSVVLQAALNGRGVALGYVSTCSYLLRKGLLVPAMTKTLKTNKHYCVVTKGNSCISPLATQVEKWISQRYDEIIEELATIIGR